MHHFGASCHVSPSTVRWAVTKIGDIWRDHVLHYIAETYRRVQSTTRIVSNALGGMVGLDMYRFQALRLSPKQSIFAALPLRKPSPIGPPHITTHPPLITPLAIQTSAHPCAINLHFSVNPHQLASTKDSRTKGGMPPFPVSAAVLRPISGHLTASTWRQRELLAAPPLAGSRPPSPSGDLGQRRRSFRRRQTTG